MTAPAPTSRAPQDPATAAPPAAAAIPRTTTLWARSRGFLAALGVLLAGGVTLAALSSDGHHGRLDPRSPDPYGSRAVSELLGQQGVTTRVVTTAREAAAATGPRTTLLVTDPDTLDATRRRTLRDAADLSGGRTVLLAPTAASLAELAPAVRAHPYSDHRALDPDCALPAARAAGRATTGDGPRYSTDAAAATACYPDAGRATLLVLPAPAKGGDTVLVGSEDILLNRTLAEEGNASLALQLLGTRPELVWYLPGPADQLAPDDPDAPEDKNLLDLVPSGWTWALLQLFVAATLAALWRGRRLGPLVTEDLPVAIRASETTEGRARLYRRAGARDRAATVLRTASRERLAALVGVPATQAHEPATLLPAVTARLTADRTTDPATLLFGTTPSDDAALVALADHLDALEREVRTS
ncbi:hypothetical protein GCM10010347_09880 [Streptomyces cirratus]|uniref:DUF4350 domain-containing protein n=1 Tax=Streptomyces cirratus TaxID=68187 RepID=A0ABQ3EMX4_9ACTN|nr:DUF4350 domain-containing protein [Streptomyces cirratus]GHB42156.1 hypothetical protein GCM10010347_09880 [Streptomyces cirratus]